MGMIPWLCSGSASKSCLVSITCTLFSFNACPYDLYHINVGNAVTIIFLFTHTNHECLWHFRLWSTVVGCGVKFLICTMNWLIELSSALPVLPTIPATPTFDFFQTDTIATLNIYTKTRSLRLDHVTADCGGEALRVLISLSDSRAFLFHLQFLHPLLNIHLLCPLFNLPPHFIVNLLSLSPVIKIYKIK